jgi:tetratricopeptide (TPR) repeat protein
MPLPAALRCFKSGLIACLLVTTESSTAVAIDGTARAIEQQFKRGEMALAQQNLTLALARQPGDVALRFLQGVMLSASGSTGEAVALFERLIEEFPDLPEPYNNLAVLQAAAGRIDTARELLETALRLDPGYRTAQENLGDVFARLAQRAYEAAAGQHPEAALQRKLRMARELAQPR